MSESVLLIGGSEEALQVNRIVLERAGFAVEALVAGEDPRRAVADSGASLVIVDLYGAGKAARRALRSLLDPEPPAGVSVLVFSPEGSPEPKTRTSFLSKPLDKDVVLERVKDLMKDATAEHGEHLRGSPAAAGE